MQPLAQPPRKEDRSFDDWMYRLWKRIASTAGVAWSLIDKTGSNLTDIQTRNHADLKNINTATYSHLSMVHATDLTDGGQSSLHGHPTSLINVSSSGAVTEIVTSQDYIDNSGSAGSVLGMALSDNGDGTINIASGEALLRTSAAENSPLISIFVAAKTSLALTDNSINYVYVDYNAGVPSILASTSLSAFNCMDKCLLYTVTREGTVLHWADARNQNVDPNRKHRRMLLECESFRHVIGGNVLSATGTRSFAISAGAFYYGLSKITVPAFDTSVSDTFTYYYRDGLGGWTRSTGNTQISNSQYDDGSGVLASLGGSKHGVHWVYLILNTPTTIAVQFGQSAYSTHSDAIAAPIPIAPPAIQGLGALIGRIIITNGDSVFEEIDSAFAMSFSASVATTHSGLAGLAWSSSGHTGTASYLAGFDGTGAASYYGLGANVATFLAIPSSANLAAAVTDETGSGALVFATSPSLSAISLDKTITPSGTTGAQTINTSTGTVNFAAGASSLVVTNSLVTANSIIQCTVGTNDATMFSVQAVGATGSFTIYANAAPTAETRVNFSITN